MKPVESQTGTGDGLNSPPWYHGGDRSVCVIPHIDSPTFLSAVPLRMDVIAAVRDYVHKMVTEVVIRNG